MGNVVRDPLGLHGDPPEDAKNRQTPREYNALVRLAALLAFNPDPAILWSRAMARHPEVLKYGAGARFVLSSSPPESAHVGTALLARRLRAELVVDMRDGWLDEPLKEVLERSALQRWREGRLEKRVLERADRIFVTSETWKTMLAARLPFTRHKTTVLTNCYPRSLFPRRAPRTTKTA